MVTSPTFCNYDTELHVYMTNSPLTFNFFTSNYFSKITLTSLQRTNSTHKKNILLVFKISVQCPLTTDSVVYANLCS